MYDRLIGGLSDKPDEPFGANVKGMLPQDRAATVDDKADLGPARDLSGLANDLYGFSRGLKGKIRDQEIKIEKNTIFKQAPIIRGLTTPGGNFALITGLVLLAAGAFYSTFDTGLAGLIAATIAYGAFANRRVLYEFLNKKVFPAKRAQTDADAIDELTAVIDSALAYIDGLKTKGGIGLTDEGWDAVLSMPIQPPFDEPNSYVRLKAQNINIESYLRYCRDFLEYIKLHPEGYKLFAKFQGPKHGFSGKYIPTLYVKGERFTHVVSPDGSCLLMPGSGAEHAGKGYSSVSKSTLHNGPRSYYNTVHFVPISNVPKYLDTLASRMRVMKTRSSQTLTARINELNKEEFLSIAKKTDKHEGTFGPGPARSGYQHGLVRLGLYFALTLSAAYLIFWAYSAIAATGILVAPAFGAKGMSWGVGISFAFSCFAFVFLGLAQKLVLTFARFFFGKDETVEEVEHIIKFVPERIVAQAITSTVDDMALDGQAEYMPECMKDIYANGTSWQNIDAEAAFREIYAHYDTNKHLLTRENISPSDHPFFRLLMQKGLLQALYLSTMKREDFVKKIRLIAEKDASVKAKLEALLRGPLFNADPNLPESWDKLTEEDGSYCSSKIVGAFDLDDIRNIVQSNPRIFPEIFLMLTIFGGTNPQQGITAGNKLTRLISTLVQYYPGSYDIKNPQDLPAKILPCTDDNDTNLFEAVERVFGEGAPLAAYRDKLLLDVTPDEGANYGKNQPKLTMKPNLNSKAVSAMQYKLGRENAEPPEYVELVDEEDILQPLLLISKMCILNLRRQAINAQKRAGRQKCQKKRQKL